MFVELLNKLDQVHLRSLPYDAAAAQSVYRLDRQLRLVLKNAGIHAYCCKDCDIWRGKHAVGECTSTRCIQQREYEKLLEQRARRRKAQAAETEDDGATDCGSNNDGDDGRDTEMKHEPVHAIHSAQRAQQRPPIGASSGPHKYSPTTEASNSSSAAAATVAPPKKSEDHTAAQSQTHRSLPRHLSHHSLGEGSDSDDSISSQHTPVTPLAVQPKRRRLAHPTDKDK